MADEKLYESPAIWDQQLQIGQSNLIRAIIDHWPGGVRSVLDVGCGDGKLTHELSRLTGADFHGFDGSREALSRLRLPSTHGDVTALPFDDDAFDVVMTTDVFEHLPDQAEKVAWRELFRVARDWVFFAVPFREELLDATTRCVDCGMHYHINWHHRSYDLDDLSCCIPAGWKLARTILSGEPWMPFLPPEIAYRRAVSNEWSGWSEAICPRCGTPCQKSASYAPIANDDAIRLGHYVYDTVAKRRFMRSHSEIIGIYCRSDLEWTSKPVLIADSEELPVAKWTPLLGTHEDLDPYPQVARMVASPDGVVVQFPVYPESIPELSIVGKHKQTVRLVVEDGCGLIFNEEVELEAQDEVVINFHREVHAGYYGLIVRLPAYEVLQSIAFGGSNARAVTHLFLKNGHVAYCVSEERAMSIQVAKPLWVDFESLFSPVYKLDQIGVLGLLEHIQRSEKSESLQASEAKLRADLKSCQASEAQLRADLKSSQASEAKLRSELRSGLLVPKSASLIRRIALFFLGDRFTSHSQHRESVLDKASPSIKHGNWNENPLLNKRFLMVCHDQDIDRRIINQARELCSAGWHGMILALSRDADDRLEGSDPLLIHRIGLSRIVPDCPVYWTMRNRERKISMFGSWARFLHQLNWQWYQLSLRRIYRSKSIAHPLPFDECFLRAARQYPADLVFAHDLPALQAACEVAEHWGAPVIYDSHELYSEQTAFSEHQRRILDERESKYAPRCARIITVSRSFAEVIAKKNKVNIPEVILNAYTDYTPPPERPTLLRDALGLSAKQRIILYQGGISHHRNLHNLVLGFLLANLADAHLVFLGPAMPEVLAELRHQAGADLGRRIHILDPVSQDTLLDFTASADFGVIPYPPVDLNTRYCMPNKLFEYIQAELPILANDLHEVGRIMRELNGGGLSLDLNTDQGMADGISAMLARDLEADRQALAAAKYRFSWSHERIRFLSVVDEAMSHSEYGRCDGR